MSKLSIGKSRRNCEKENITPENDKEAKMFFVIGCILVSLMLIPSVDTANNDYTEGDTAVQVLSSAVEAVDEIKQSTEDVSAESKTWSVYDYIGQMFAQLLFGDR